MGKRGEVSKIWLVHFHRNLLLGRQHWYAAFEGMESEVIPPLPADGTLSGDFRRLKCMFWLFFVGSIEFCVDRAGQSG